MAWVDFLSLWGAKLIGLGAILLLVLWIWETVFDRVVRLFDMQWEFIQWYAGKRYRLKNLKKEKDGKADA